MAREKKQAPGPPKPPVNEAALGESEARFKAIFEGATDGIIAVDMETRKFAFGNPRICEITGYPLDELLALGVTEIHPKKDLPFVLGEFKKQAEGKKTLAKNLPVLRKDGKVVYCDVNSKPIQINGKDYLVGFFRDMTEQRRAEETLLASEAKFRSIAENMNDALYLHDFAGRIIYVNENACRMLGYKREELVGSPLKKIDTKENAALMGKRINELIAKGTLVFDGTHRRKDGTAVPVGISVKVVSNEGGGLVQSVVRDITEQTKAEAALRGSEERFRGLVETSSDWIWEVDASGRYTYVSPRVYEILGYRPEEVIGKTPFDFMPPDEAKRVAHVFGSFIAGHKPIPGLENTNRHKSGRLVVLETTGVPFFGPDGELLGYHGVDRDVTERKKAEEQVESLSRFPNENPNPVLRITFSGELLYANKAAEKLMRKAGGFEKLALFTNKGLQAEYEKSVKTGRPMAPKKITLGKNTYAYTIVPIKDKGYVNIYAQNVTELEKTEETLRENDGIFNELLLNSPVLVYVKDDQLRTIKASDNFKDLLGKPTSELIGKNAMDLFPPEFAKSAIADDLNVLKGNRVVTSTEQLGGRTYMTIKFPIPGKGGRTYLGGFSVDITERKKAEDETRKSMELRAEFVRNVSHELRTPLTTMRMAVEMIGKMYPDIAKSQLYDVLFRNTLRLNTTINSILDLSRIRAGKATYAMRRTNMSRLVKTAVAEMNDNAARKGLYLRLSTHGKAPVVWCDSESVGRVVMNLISNAVKFTEKGGVAVTVSSTKGSVVVRVKDTGRGFSEEELPRIFTEFFKTNVTMVGTGIGMAISKETIDAHGGKIWCMSKGKGRGATFIFTLPLGKRRSK